MTVLAVALPLILLGLATAGFILAVLVAILLVVAAIGLVIRPRASRS